LQAATNKQDATMSYGLPTKDKWSELPAQSVFISVIYAPLLLEQLLWKDGQERSWI
jgi:hypothetical protein